MHRELVEQRPWLSDKQFLGALSFCMMLPGPEAMQLATFTGWKLRGTIGGLIGGLLFVLPGALVIALLGGLYIGFGDLPLVKAAFLGVQAAVVAIILQALIRLSGRVLIDWPARIAALLAFLVLFTSALPFPAVVMIASFVGMLRPRADDSFPAPPRAAPWKDTVRTILVWGTLWLVPIAVLMVSGATFLTDVALFFSKLAVVTFGGAYAVLAYMVQAVVSEHHWLTTAQMMDALGLAETTPGPLILVTQFVGQLAGYQQGGVLLAVATGLITLWCTFIPCFLWIFAGAPYVERLLQLPRLNSALAMISAAIVGVIANLGLWFSLHVLFEDHVVVDLGTLPVLSSFQPMELALVAFGCVLIFALRLSVVATLSACALAAMNFVWI
ncbi:chromate transporter [Shimia gijangensis]|uniref:Chromate transporter n=2 Tax=Shimia gijangensis TaxID=1470563 RepID=A0A1M6QUD6_9RHOB|nr:chromate transporter [Shimia gijangensis]